MTSSLSLQSAAATIGPVSTINGIEALHVDRAIHMNCRAVVIIPARNEEQTLTATLDALRQQRSSTAGPLLRHECYEVLLLLNNCTDATVAVAERYASAFPEFALHSVVRDFPGEHAHVGTARRLLMDAACSRLDSLDPFRSGSSAILSTDADTIVAEDWITANLTALQSGAEVVGGVIHLRHDELNSLNEGTRLAYRRDRSYQAKVAELESLLDPDPDDPWPRHLEHFGASLACTPEVYRRSGGLPPVKPLEDVAFIDALRRIGARIRHAPEVHIHTSARLDGRAEVGLSGQLRHWRHECETGTPHLVQTADWLAHRFRTLNLLRRLCGADALQEVPFADRWAERLGSAHAQRLPIPRFLEVVDCDALIEETYTGGPRLGEIGSVLIALDAAIAAARAEAAAAPLG